MAHHYTGLLNILSPDRPTKQFALRAAEIVPTTDKVVSYGTVPSNFIHYFGRTVVKVQDVSGLNNLYQQNYWVVSFGKSMDELLNTGRFNLVHMDTKAKQRGENISAGGLFHGQLAVKKD
jgi:hypothetical protein